MTFLIYGATGYTGRLCAEHAVERELRPVLASRSPDKLRPFAEGLGLEWRPFALAPRPAELRGVEAVLHAAGPFSATAASMASACIEAGDHYCDITGEIDVFKALAALSGRARDAGLMLLPGAGFDVVPSDCLAPSASPLSIGSLAKASRGTMKTMLEGVGMGVRVRRGDAVVQGATTAAVARRIAQCRVACAASMTSSSPHGRFAEPFSTLMRSTLPTRRGSRRSCHTQKASRASASLTTGFGLTSM